MREQPWIHVRCALCWLGGLLLAALQPGCAAWREQMAPGPTVSEQRAARHLETVQSFEQHRDKAQLAAAIERFEQGDAAGCHSRLATLVERRPEFLEARLHLAEVSWALGDPLAAEEHYRAVLAMAADHDEARHGLGTLLTSQGRFEEAAPYLAVPSGGEPAPASLATPLAPDAE